MKLNILIDSFSNLIVTLIVFYFISTSYLYFNCTSDKIKDDLRDYLSTRRQKNPSSAGFLKTEGVIFDSISETEFDLNNSFSVSSSSILSSNRNSTILTQSSISNNSKFQFDQKSLNSNLKPSLTDSYLIDDEIHKIIELVIRDYVDSWYKTEISGKEDFSQLIRILIYNSIKQMHVK